MQTYKKNKHVTMQKILCNHLPTKHAYTLHKPFAQYVSSVCTWLNTLKTNHPELT